MPIRNLQGDLNEAEAADATRGRFQAAMWKLG